jgi:hypothetical protein
MERGRGARHGNDNGIPDRRTRWVDVQIVSARCIEHKSQLLSAVAGRWTCLDYYWNAAVALCTQPSQLLTFLAGKSGNWEAVRWMAI